jgi:hypothetical protein
VGLRVRLAVSLVWVLAGCVSKGDIQRVQDDVALFKAETARRESVRAAQLNELIRVQQRLMDSLTSSRRAVGQLRGDLASDLYNIQQQLVQLQELTGQGRTTGYCCAGRYQPAWRQLRGVGRPDVRSVAGTAPARQHLYGPSRAAGDAPGLSQ